MISRLLAGMIAIMSVSSLSGVADVNANSKDVSQSEKDVRIIVECNENIKDLSKSEIISSQDSVIASIKKHVTKNFELKNRYTVLNNAFVLEVSKTDVDAIRALPEVASVTVDKIHAKKDISDGDYYSVSIQRGANPEEDTGEMVENISAKTMNKPTGTNEGEGTVIAILDNEFYLRGRTATSDPWNHAVYKALPAGVAQRFTFENLTDVIKDLPHASRKKDVPAGTEGSLYFNTKVPFYYDYGGESKDYGKVGPMDYDVSSTLTYHGSHVASIASANADTYKGIAPNAQLACMKVFTTYEASKTGEQMGFGTSTGAYDTAILSALEDAIALGVDGINMSLGSDLDDFDGDSITLKTLASLGEDSGIMSAISAGNAGKMSYSFTGGYGNWTTDMVETGILGSYANSAASTIVASGQPTEIYFENAIRTGGKNIAFEDQIVNREGMEADYPEDNQHWLKELQDNFGTTIDWVYVPGFGTAADYSGLDVKDKVAVVNRGSTSFADKYNIAANKGAIAIIIINNDPTANDFNFRCSFGDDFTPSIPCALVLYKDKPVFESQQSGTFTFIFKEVSENDLARTISTFSSDGAKWNFDLKPDITTPGENIRGAVPPQKKEHREETPYSTYEYLSGTSMAAPNYAGAQSLILSKVAKGLLADGELTVAEEEQIEAFRKTVDMRLMSTANPMLDSKANPELPESAAPNYTSPRLQGAGMVDLNKAYNTDVYLEGLNIAGTAVGKSKICLYNNEKIANGTLGLSFLAHNEGAAKTYKAKVTVMRPAVTTNNKVIPDKYHYTGEIDAVEKIPGLTYYTKQFSPSAGGEITKKVTNDANASYNDVLKLTKQIIYYDNQANFEAEVDGIVLDPGYYKNVATEGCVWEPLEGFEYQSVQDAVIATFEQENITIPAGNNTITLADWNIPAETKADILEKFEYGCAIEGFVELIQDDETKLSIPYLGFYSGEDVNGRTLKDAPVVEPFSFEKDPGQIYPSDLTNDVAKQLVGKDNCEFGSTWTVGYAESPNYIDTDGVLQNNTSFEGMLGWHKVGTNPLDEEYYDNPADNIYVGNPEKTNTMIIQQYVMRSVKDNFFTIKNAKGEVVYKSILEDLLFGDDGQLYKSHVDANYLSAGYIAHRAYAIIPLYDLTSRKAFASGQYELEFNYQLQCDGSWVSKAYHFTIDNEAPVVTGINNYVSESGEERVRISISDQKVAYASLGIRMVDVQFSEVTGQYYIDESLETIKSIMDQLGVLENGQKRLTVTVTDAAYGQSTAIIHFFGSTFNNYVMAQGPGLQSNQDFVKDGDSVTWFTLSYGGTQTEFAQDGYVTIYTHISNENEAVHHHVDANNDHLCDICGEELKGEGSKEKLTFAQKIKNFFKKLGDAFKNLFKGKKNK